MQVSLIAVGQKMPAWVKLGYEEYARRMPPECQLQLTEIPLAKRSKGGDIGRAIDKEGEQMLAAVKKGSLVVAMEVNGTPWSTTDLAAQMTQWMQSGCDVALLVGGPDGLSPACRKRADRQWSLSSLTLPHPLVRIVIAEQLYRAVSILKHHPYHK